MFLSLRKRDCVRVKRSNHKVNKSIQQQASSAACLQRARKNILINLFIVTILFVVLVTPSMGATINLVLQEVEDQSNKIKPIYRIGLISLLTNSVVNPFVYAFRYNKFQNAMRVMFRCKE